ncbi:MAG: YigZ family protein, partial [Deltaproteobacteria bacterium]
ESEIKIRRSRFIAVAAPAVDEQAARIIITQVAKRFHDSRHVCHAWRLGTPAAYTENRRDDGEPAGTAGEPALAEIRKRDLTQTVVVVVRYFGGIKLGTGGLARAYGQAAGAALDLAPVHTVRLGREFRLEFPYTLQKTITHLLEQHGGEVVQETYGADVSWQIWLPNSRWQSLAAKLTEASAGKIRLRE